MAQQPNIELAQGDRPRSVPTPDASRRWTPGMRPGVINSPADRPEGDGFGAPGPDAGWAIKLIRNADLDQRAAKSESLLSAIMTARAAQFGRAPIPEDLEAAIILCGFDQGAHPSNEERGLRWQLATSHEKPKGKMALSEIDSALLMEKPASIRALLGDALIV